MFIISDSNTFLLEKTAQQNNINIDGIISLSPECDLQIKNNCIEILFLISEIIYKKFYSKNYQLDNVEKQLSNEFEIIDEIIKNLSEKGAEIYLPFVPKHFIYHDKFDSFFYEKQSYDFFIDSANQLFFKKYNHLSNVIFLKGIINLSPLISKTYFRFGSIYDKENSTKILDQYNKYRETKFLKKKKLIIFDLDNTIWKGILGDDSIEGIRMALSDPVGAVFNNVQKILLSLKEKGFLLAVSSKNEEELALKCLFKHQSSSFSKNDIVTYRINWEPKSQNIKSICEELNISISDTIFIDDSDYECDEVKNNCPGIAIFKVPKDIYKYPYQLANNDLFYLGHTSNEDRNRTLMYKDNQKRKAIYNEVIEKKGSKDKWISSLEVKIEINRLNNKNKNKDRIIQLFNRTNQFNLKGERFNIIKLNEKLDNNNNYYYFGSASDRIGSEGTISVLGFALKGKKLVVENYILSCRVFGRYIEESMLLPLFEHAIKVERDIYFEYINTSRNIVIKKFLKNLTSDKYYLPLNKIKDLHNEFSQLPIDIIINQ